MKVQPVGQTPTPPSLAGQQPAPSSPHQPSWFMEFVVKPLIPALIGLLLGTSSTGLWVWLHRPPSDDTVIYLMQQEVQAGKTRDIRLVASIYDERAVVTDAGCLTPNQGTVWSGLPRITARYLELPQFASLNHTDPHVSWYPDDSSAQIAYASASTLGAIALSDQKLQPIRGHEQWVFAQVNGQWRITSFTYNLCMPTG